ncbi:MAG: hypothetical protein GXP19_08500 [Gammaproteobacteria bacterium]|nr:hypothetical protein [Gammaproteobacteria bacterium]
MKYSIRRRLLIWLITFSVVICSISSLIIYNETHNEVGKLFDAQLEQSAKILLNMSAHELHEQLAFNQQGSDQANRLPQTFPIDENVYEQIIDYQVWLNGDILAVRTSSAPDYRLTEREKTFSDLVLEDGTNRRTYAISNSEKTIQVQIMADYTDRDRLTNAISFHYMTSLAIILPFIALVIYFSVGRAMAPLKKIAKEIENRKSDDLHPISTGAIPVEVDKMISALNRLFDRLYKAFENIRRFTSDAAHELRTPLAVLKIHSQLAIKAKDEPSRIEAVDEIFDEVCQLSTLVEQLLTLSRLDPEDSLQKTEQLDLSKMAKDVIANQAPKALEKNLDISLNAYQPFVISARLGLIPILMRNLIDNAINYTPENGKVKVTIYQKKSQTLLEIDDSGPGISGIERQKVFERFYRCSATKIAGYGLGLSIVKRIGEIHNARIALKKSAFGGLRVIVEFPNATYALK